MLQPNVGDSEPNANVDLSESKKREREWSQSPPSSAPKKKIVNMAPPEGNLKEGNLLEKIELILDKKITELKTDLKSDLERLSGQIGNMEKENRVLKQELQAIKSELNVYKDKVEGLDRWQRQKNLVLKGIKRTDDVSTIKRLLQDLAGEKTVTVVRCHTLGTKSVGPHPILVEIDNGDIVPDILKNAAKLKDTGYSITRDMSQEARVRCNRFLRLRFELRKQCPEKKFAGQYDKLVHEKTVWQWRGDELMAGTENGLQALLKVTGKDFSNTVQEILRYKPPGEKGSR